jgi:adhesin/invasin
MPVSRRFARLFAAMLLVTSCKDATAPRVATTLTLSQTSASLDAIGASQPITASVLDQDGKPMPSVAVTWTTSSPDVASVNATGTILAVSPGSAVVTAHAATLTTPVTVTVTQTPTAPQKVAGDQQSIAVGGSVQLTVKVQDRLGNPMAGRAVTFTVVSGGGSVAAASVTSAADGSASTTWTLGTNSTVQHQVAAAVDGAAATSTFTATALPGPPTGATSTTGNNQTVSVGGAVTPPPSVRVSDSFGNPVSGVGVTFTVGAGGGSVSLVSGGGGGSGRANLVSSIVTTNASGIAAVASWTLGTGLGTNTLLATPTGLAPVTFTAQAVAGPPASASAQVGNAQTGSIGLPVLVRPAVRVADAFNNPVAGVNVVFAVTSGGGNATGTTATTDALGIATIGSWTLGAVPGANTLSATATGLATVNFTATGVQAPASIVINAGNAQSAIAGTAVAIPPAVRVTDALGNAIANISVVFAVTSGGGAITGATAVANANGVATLGSWTLGTVAGANTLSATVSGLAAIVITATGTAGAPASVAISTGNNQSATVGTNVATKPAVVVRDANNNGVPGVTVTFVVASGGGSVTGGTVLTGATGIATIGNWTLGAAAGSNTMTATVTGAAISGNPVTFTATGTAGGGGGGFNIEVRFTTSMTPTQQQAFTNAAARWQSIITGDLPSVNVNFPANACASNTPAINETVDDLVIFAAVQPIDGPSGILGQAGPCGVRSNLLPFLGIMQFDIADVAALEASGRLETVILHEMGHVLGFGTIWPDLGLLANPSLPSSPGVDTRMTGANAIAGFNLVGGATYTGGGKVPVENNAAFGAGSRDSHWRESVLVNELMTPALDNGVPAPLSVMTIMSMADLGYAVNTGAADAFSRTLSLRAGPPDPAYPPILMGDDVYRGPIYKVDASGRAVRINRK